MYYLVDKNVQKLSISEIQAIRKSMNPASQILEQADSVVKSLTPEVLRMISVSLQYSVIIDNFEPLKHQLEAAGFMVGINSQCGKALNITLTYLRNWG